ncbi:UNVERIFIED_CONTAM: hypothetical protein PYX00_001383 [Menopon gallinae]|uniref:Titin homolog n=1 Tax=Menopon gallinae TaxID=328185 RepID=A0AAW2ICN6_9NEOP
MEDGLGGYSIEIYPLEACDEGEWKCVATSDSGVISITKCMISMTYPKNYRKPKFLESLKAILTEEGLVSFECKVVGFPTPRLQWFKDGEELRPGDVYQLTGTNSLGSYSCIARNCMGEARSTAELTVEDIQGQLNEEEKMHLFSKNQPPRFIRGLKSCEAKINEDFRFTVQVTLSPGANLFWYRDDEKIEEGERFSMVKENVGVCHLVVKKLEINDQAEWKCVASNEFGQSITTGFLKLTIPKHYKKPKFLECLRAIMSEEGAVNLECKVIGVPQPVLKWYKDGKELKPGDIHRIISGEDGKCCLGTYTCEARNCMGVASSSASLLGFEDRKAIKEVPRYVPEPLYPLAKNTSLSTIHEERTSQMYDTPGTEHSITMDERGDVSFSFDGKEVSISLYETPDLTEEEALQVVEMYAEELSEHISEQNVVELPPMRFTKESSKSGPLLMEAVVIDVSEDYFSTAEDDLRTEADFEDVSMAEEGTHNLASPEVENQAFFEKINSDFLEKALASLSGNEQSAKKKSSSDGKDKSDSYKSLSSPKKGSVKGSREEVSGGDEMSDSKAESFGSAKGSSGLVKQESDPSKKDEKGKKKISRSRSTSMDSRNHSFDEKVEEGMVTITPKRPSISRSSSGGSDEKSSPKKVKKPKSGSEDAEETATRRRRSSRSASESMDETIVDNLKKKRKSHSRSQSAESETTETLVSTKKVKKKKVQPTEGAKAKEESRKSASRASSSEKESMKGEKKRRISASSTDSAGKEGVTPTATDETATTKKKKVRSRSSSTDRSKKDSERKKSLEMIKKTIAAEVEAPVVKKLEEQEKKAEESKIVETSLKEIQNVLNVVKEQVIQKSEKAVESGVISESFQKLQEGLQVVQDELKLEEVSENVLHEIVKPVQNFEQGLRLTAEQKTPECAWEMLSAVTNQLQEQLKTVTAKIVDVSADSLAMAITTLLEPIENVAAFVSDVKKPQAESLTSVELLQNLAQPVQELQEVIESAKEQHATTSEVISSLTEPVKHLLSAITIVERKAELEMEQDESVSEKILEKVSRPIAVINEELKAIEHQIEMEQAEDLPMDSSEILEALSQPIQDLHRGLAEVVQEVLFCPPKETDVTILRDIVKSTTDVIESLRTTTSDAPPSQEQRKIIFSSLETPLSALRESVTVIKEMLAPENLKEIPQETIRSNVMSVLGKPLRDLQHCLQGIESDMNQIPAEIGIQVNKENILQIVKDMEKGVAEVTEGEKPVTDLLSSLLPPLRDLRANLEEKKLRHPLSKSSSSLGKSLDLIKQTSEDDRAEVEEMKINLSVLRPLEKPLQDLEEGFGSLEEHILQKEGISPKEKPTIERQLQTLLEILSQSFEVFQEKWMMIEANKEGNASLMEANALLELVKDLKKGTETIQENLVELETISPDTKRVVRENVNTNLKNLKKSIIQVENLIVQESVQVIPEFQTLTANIAKVQENMQALKEKLPESKKALEKVVKPIADVQKTLEKVKLEEKADEEKPALDVVVEKTLKAFKAELEQTERSLAAEPKSIVGPFMELKKAVEQEIAKEATVETLEPIAKSLEKFAREIQAAGGKTPSDTLTEVISLVQLNIAAIDVLENQNNEAVEPLKEPLSKLNEKLQEIKVAGSEMADQNSIVVLQNLVEPLNELKEGLGEAAVEPGVLKTSIAEMQKGIATIQQQAALRIDDDGMPEHTHPMVLETLLEPFQELQESLAKATEKISESELVVAEVANLKSEVVQALSQSLPPETVRALESLQEALESGKDVAEAVAEVQCQIENASPKEKKTLLKLRTELENVEEVLNATDVVIKKKKKKDDLVSSLETAVKELQHGLESAIEVFKDEGQNLQFLTVPLYELGKALEKIQTEENLTRSVEVKHQLVELAHGLQEFEEAAAGSEAMKALSIPIKENMAVISNMTTAEEKATELPELKKQVKALTAVLHGLQEAVEVAEGNLESEVGTLKVDSSFIKTIAQPVQELKHALAEIKEHVQLEKEDNLESAILQTLAKPIQQLQMAVAVCEQQAMETSETIPSLTLEQISQPILELNRGLAQIQQQVTLLSEKESKPAEEIVKSVAKPIQELVKEIATIQEHLPVEPDVISASNKTEISVMKTLAKPVEEMQKIIAVVEEKHFFEPEAQSMSSLQDATIAKPLQNLKHALEQLQNLVLEGTSAAECASAVEAVAKPVRELEHVFAVIQSHECAKGETTAPAAELQLVETLATPVHELATGLVVVQQQLAESGVSFNENKTEPTSFLTTLIKPEELQKMIALVQEYQLMEPEAESISSLHDATIAQPLQSLRHGLEQLQNVIMEATTAAECAPALEAVAKPVCELEKRIATMLSHEQFKEETAEETKEMEILTKLATPIHELASGLVVLEQQIMGSSVKSLSDLVLAMETIGKVETLSPLEKVAVQEQVAFEAEGNTLSQLTNFEEATLRSATLREANAVQTEIVQQDENVISIKSLPQGDKTRAVEEEVPQRDTATSLQAVVLEADEVLQRAKSEASPVTTESQEVTSEYTETLSEVESIKSVSEIESDAFKPKKADEKKAQEENEKAEVNERITKKTEVDLGLAAKPGEKTKTEVEEKREMTESKSREADVPKKKGEEVMQQKKEQEEVQKREENISTKLKDEAEAKTKKDDDEEKPKSDTEGKKRQVDEEKTKREREEKEAKLKAEIEDQKNEEEAKLKAETKAKEKKEEEEAKKKKEDEEVTKKQKEEEQTKLKAEVDAKKKHEEEVKNKEEEEAKKKKEEESETRKAEEEAKRKEEEAKKKKEEDEKLKVESEAKKKQEEEARRKEEEEAKKKKEEEEAKLKADIEAKKKEEEAKKKEEEEAKLKAENEARKKLEEEANKKKEEEEAKRKEEEEAKLKAEAKKKKEEEEAAKKKKDEEEEAREKKEEEEAKKKKEEEEAKLKAEAEAKKKKEEEEAEARKKQEEEAKKKKEEEEAKKKKEEEEAKKKKEEEEAKKKKEEEEAKKRKEEEEAKLKAEAEAKKKKEQEEAKKKEEEEAKLKAEAEAKKKKEEEEAKKKKEEEEAKKKEEEEAKLKAEADAKKKKEEEEAKLKAEAEAKKKRDEEEAKKKKEEEEKKKKEEEAKKKKEEEEAKLKAEAEAKKKREEEEAEARKKQEEEAKKKEEEEAKRKKEQEEAKKKKEEEEAKKKKEEEEAAKKKKEEEEIKKKKEEEEAKLKAEAEAKKKKEEEEAAKKKKDEEEEARKKKEEEEAKKKKEEEEAKLKAEAEAKKKKEEEEAEARKKQEEEAKKKKKEEEEAQKKKEEEEAKKKKEEEEKKKKEEEAAKKKKEEEEAKKKKEEEAKKKKEEEEAKKKKEEEEAKKKKEEEEAKLKAEAEAKKKKEEEEAKKKKEEKAKKKKEEEEAKKKKEEEEAKKKEEEEANLKAEAEAKKKKEEEVKRKEEEEAKKKDAEEEAKKIKKEEEEMAKEKQEGDVQVTEGKQKQDEESAAQKKKDEVDDKNKKRKSSKKKKEEEEAKKKKEEDAKSKADAESKTKEEESRKKQQEQAELESAADSKKEKDEVEEKVKKETKLRDDLAENKNDEQKERLLEDVTKEKAEDRFTTKQKEVDDSRAVKGVASDEDEIRLKKRDREEKDSVSEREEPSIGRRTERETASQKEVDRRRGVRAKWRDAEEMIRTGRGAAKHRDVLDTVKETDVDREEVESPRARTRPEQKKLTPTDTSKKSPEREHSRGRTVLSRDSDYASRRTASPAPAYLRGEYTRRTPSRDFRFDYDILPEIGLKYKSKLESIGKQSWRTLHRPDYGRSLIDVRSYREQRKMHDITRRDFRRIAGKDYSSSLDDLTLRLAGSEYSGTQGKEVPRDKKGKPVFCSRLVDRTAPRGSRVKLTCTVLGTPEPSVKWLRHGLPLIPTPGDRYSAKIRDGIASLEIEGATQLDNGEYTCLAQNIHGESSTTCKLRIFDGYDPAPFPPTFTTAVRESYKFTEDELILECRVRSHPPPKVQWLRNGVPLRPSPRYQQTESSDGICRLIISHPEVDDSGDYTCRAENQVADNSVAHRVKFLGRQHYAEARKAATRSPKDFRKPHFRSELTDHLVPAGGTIALQVEVRGLPPPEVKWLRGNEELPRSSSKVRFFEDSGVHTLLVSNASETEAGIYSCHAYNAFGHVRTTAAVEVMPVTTMRSGKPPKVVNRPKDIMVANVEDDVVITCRVTGDPRPRVSWMKGTKDITITQRTMVDHSDDYYRFTLKKVVPADAGTYWIIAKNIHGHDRAFVTLQVKQRARSLTPGGFSSSRWDWGAPSDSSSEILSEIHDREKYNRKETPGPITSEPFVADSGRNWLTLSWKKPSNRGGAPVIAYRVDAWEIGQDGGARWSELGITPVNTFDAYNLKKGKEYKFRITPRNRYGWGEPLITSSPVTVGFKGGNMPEFTKILPGQLKALYGASIRLECHVTSDLPPETFWYKDGIPLDLSSPRLSSDFDGTVCQLVVSDLVEEDSGRYMCEAVSKVGRVSTFARLMVVKDAKVWEADTNLKRGVFDEEGIPPESPPLFTMRLRDRRVQMTYPVRLTCQVVGSPTPEVKWYHEGKELNQDDRHTFSSEDHFHTLEMSKTTLEDAGCYTATAKNDYGSVSCRCNLVVDKGIRAYVAPEFVRELEVTRVVRCGDEMHLTAQVEAYPSVGVVWHRNGVRLRPSRRIVMTLNHEGLVELIVGGVTEKDSGVYACTATNEVGRCETVCRVSIQSGSQAIPRIEEPELPYSKAPMFVKKPRSNEAVEGDAVVIECQVIGDPKPEVYWLRDFLKPEYYRDAPLFRRIGDGTNYRLEIPHVKLDHTGTYTVVARNTHGEVKAVTSLQVYAKGQGKEDRMDSTPVTHGKVETLPVFKKGLKHIRCCDGDAVTLECEVEASPEPQIKWRKGERAVPLGGDFSAEFDGRVARLIINQVYPEDEGEYVCEASNDVGKTATSACLVVDVPEEKENLLSRQLTRPPGLMSGCSTPRSTPRTTPSRSISPYPAGYRFRSTSPGTRPRRLKVAPPKFYAVPHNRIAQEGETVRFQCAVAGHPAPWVTWDKDGRIVTPTARITMSEKEDLKILEISEVTAEDAGLYRIVVENEVGRIEATARLEVIGHRAYEAKTQRVRAWSASPTFRRRPCSSIGRLGDNVTLACDIRSSPNPVTSWYRNGELVVRTNRVTPTWNGETAMLEIENLEMEDAGVYTCVAENEFGKAECSTEVVVLEDDPARASAPVFLEPLNDVVAEEGRAIELQTRIQGDGPLEIVWSKDNKEIPDCEDFHYVDYGDGRYGLRIADTFIEDSGEYSCEVFNKFGDAISSARVWVKDGAPRIVFSKIPTSAVIACGKSATFCSRIESTGSQTPVVSWIVADREIGTGSSGKYSVEEDGDVSFLHISSVDFSDAGRITCVARYGCSLCDAGKCECRDSRVTCSAELTVVSDEWVSDSECDALTNCDTRGEARTAAKMSMGSNAKDDSERAQILLGPADVRIFRGGSAILTAKYCGQPKPKVRWTKGGRQLTDDNRIRITKGKGSTTLRIDSVSSDDSGKYVVSVENVHGSDRHFASLAVEGPPEPPSGRPTATVLSADSAAIEWSSPAFDGGCKITEYAIEMKSSSDPDWKVVAIVCDSLSHVLKNLQQDEKYKFRIMAENKHGRSEPSSESNELNLKELRKECSLFAHPKTVTVEDGELFKAKFEVLEELGKGRFGIVHKVADLDTGEKLAAKFIRCITVKDREKVKDEIAIMNCLRHPKLLQLAAAFESPREMVMVMEYISGGELFERVVADDFQLTERDCILFMRQICEGVRYMHENSVVHLDLKPENIMCQTRTSHEIKLIDFGLAQKIDPENPVRVLFGTPEFVPPEVINYEPIGFESDMWSVGVICYVLLSGLSPFMGENDAETFANITRASYDFDEEAFRVISQDAKDFISSLLVKRKEKRLTASECLRNKWMLSEHDETMGVILSTDKLKKFIIRRKWQSTGRSRRG